MTHDPDRWLERLLVRHPDAMLADLDGGRPAVVRRDELLVAAGDAREVEHRARRWIDRVETDEDAGVARLRLRRETGSRPAELADDLVRARRAGRRTMISPNHLLAGAPGTWGGGPADAPRPSLEPPPAPGRPLGTEHDVVVAVIDTGVAAHPWFDGSTWWPDVGPEDHEVLDDLPCDDRLDTQAGHGTFVVGVVLQHAPSAYVLAPRTLASDGVCDELDLVRALRRLRRWSKRHGRTVDVVNLSLGGYTFDDQPSPLVARAIERLGPDTVVVACAGNDGASRPYWPAALGPVVAVGALDAPGEAPAQFSNRGWWVDAWAVGQDVSSAFVEFDGPFPAADGGDPDRFDGYATWSGTSFAAPQVAGAIAARVAERGVSGPDATDLVLGELGGPRTPST